MKIGVLIRVFAVRADLIPAESQKAHTAVTRLLSAKACVPEIDTILLVVPTDKRFFDSDCGAMAESLRTMFAEDQYQKVQIVESPVGDISCAAMNFGYHYLEQSGHTHTLSLSSTVSSYMTPRVLSAMIDAVRKGARIVPLAVGDMKLRRFVLNGRPLGTCCIWEHEMLKCIGGFNPIASRPMRPEYSTLPQIVYADDLMGTQTSPQYVPFGGMEEVLTALMAIQLYQRCIAPINPIGLVNGYWEQPIAKDRKKRERLKMLSKMQRTIALAMMFNAGPGSFRLGIMAGYEPKPEDIDF